MCYADAKKPLSGALTLPIVGADARKVRNVLRCPGRVRLKPARLWTYGTVLPQVVAQGGSAVIGQLRLHFSVFTPFRHDHNLGSVRSWDRLCPGVLCTNLASRSCTCQSTSRLQDGLTASNLFSVVSHLVRSKSEGVPMPNPLS